MARLEGLHIRAAYRMAKEHKPKWGPDWVWTYPRSEDVLKECGMKTMEEYILIRWQAVALYLVTRPTLTKCRRANGREGQNHTNGGGNNPLTWTSTTQLGQTSDGPGPLPSLFCIGGVRLVGTR
jgi:hypothetical protein